MQRRPGHPHENADVSECGDMIQVASTEEPPSNAGDLVSIVIPTHGRPDMVRQSVESALKQSHGNVEVIVIDDAGTPCAPQDWADTRARTIRLQENKGVAAARNLGAQSARGSWLVFLDDDDALDEKFLEQTLRLGTTQSAEIVTCWSGPMGRPSQAREGRRLNGNVHNQIIDGIAPHLGATLVRRDAWRSFDERYRACQDLEWWLRVSQASKVLTLPQYLHLWREHDGERHGNGTRARIAFSKQLIEEHHNYFESHPRALAFRWYRIAVMHARLGEQGASRDALIRCIRQGRSDWLLRAAVRYARSAVYRKTW